MVASSHGREDETSPEEECNAIFGAVLSSLFAKTKADGGTRVFETRSLKSMLKYENFMMLILSWWRG